MSDLISRQDSIYSLKEEFYEDAENDYEEGFNEGIRKAIWVLDTWTPSAQPEDWMERNKERILQAGMEGREVEFYIGGRLFAIREIAQ